MDAEAAAKAIAPWLGLLAVAGAISMAIMTYFLNRQIENLRDELRARAFERETRFARLHERRIEILADIYAKIGSAEIYLTSATSLAGYPGYLGHCRKHRQLSRPWVILTTGTASGSMTTSLLSSEISPD